MLKNKIAIILIIPDFTNNNDCLIWNRHIQEAELWNIQSFLNNDDNINKNKLKWSYGMVMWNKIIHKYPYLKDHVYVIRTSKYLNNEFNIHYYDNVKILEFKYDNPYGHIMYKTIETFKKIGMNYDFFIRGNINMMINIKTLDNLISSLNFPKNKLYFSPFYEGNSYAFGCFNLFSKDNIKYIINHQKKEWFNQPYADDYGLSNSCRDNKSLHFLGIKNLNCYPPKKNYKVGEKTWINEFGIIGSESQPTDELIKSLDMCHDLSFYFRFRNLQDYNYPKLYDYLIKNKL